MPERSRRRLDGDSRPSIRSTDSRLDPPALFDAYTTVRFRLISPRLASRRDRTDETPIYLL
jgi:hypothetical protein